jgi:hypothetical protein
LMMFRPVFSAYSVFSTVEWFLLRAPLHLRAIS